MHRSFLHALIVLVLTLSAVVMGACAQVTPAPSAPNAPAATSAPAASAAPQSTGSKTLTIAQTSDPGTADPQLTTEEYFLPLNVFDRLVEAVTTSPGVSELQPGLAEKWEVSD